MTEILKCSFCRKTEHQVRKLVAGRDGYICDDCIHLASKIIDEQDSPPDGASHWKQIWLRVRSALASVRSVSRSLLGSPGTA